MLRLSNVRMSFKVGALGAVGILGLLLVGVIYFIGSESQLRYQTASDSASAAGTTTKNFYTAAPAAPPREGLSAPQR